MATTGCISAHILSGSWLTGYCAYCKGGQVGSQTGSQMGQQGMGTTTGAAGAAAAGVMAHDRHKEGAGLREMVRLLTS